MEKRHSGALDASLILAVVIVMIIGGLLFFRIQAGSKNNAAQVTAPTDSATTESEPQTVSDSTATIRETLQELETETHTEGDEVEEKHDLDFTFDLPEGWENAAISGGGVSERTIQSYSLKYTDPKEDEGKYCFGSTRKGNSLLVEIVHFEDAAMTPAQRAARDFEQFGTSFKDGGYKTETSTDTYGNEVILVEADLKECGKWYDYYSLQEDGSAVWIHYYANSDSPEFENGLKLFNSISY